MAREIGADGERWEGRRELGGREGQTQAGRESIHATPLSEDAIASSPQYFKSDRFSLLLRRTMLC